MTREEMWEEFESQLKSEVRTPITMSYDDSIRLAEMGIKDVVARWKKRIEQEPSGDAVSRQAVLETLDDMDDVLDEDRTIENYKELLKECYEVLPPVNPKSCDDAISRRYLLDNCVVDKVSMPYVPINRIENAPSVRPQEPKTGEWIADVDGYTCSKCGVFNTNDDKFCPNCGADMRGDAESEEVDADSD